MERAGDEEGDWMRGTEKEKNREINDNNNKQNYTTHQSEHKESKTDLID